MFIIHFALAMYAVAMPILCIASIAKKKFGFATMYFSVGCACTTALLATV